MSTYVAEYARSGRSKCKACKTVITNADLRLGAETEKDDHPMIYWRHWNCITTKVILNIGDTSNLKGFDLLTNSDQNRINLTFAVEAAKKRIQQEKDTAKHEKGEEKPAKKKRKTKTEGENSSTKAHIRKKQNLYAECA